MLTKRKMQNIKIRPVMLGYIIIKQGDRIEYRGGNDWYPRRESAKLYITSSDAMSALVVCRMKQGKKSES